MDPGVSLNDETRLAGRRGKPGDRRRPPGISSWNSAHASRGCGQEDLKASGGDGLFYCFAAR
jgi:hypothetical protein